MLLKAISISSDQGTELLKVGLILYYFPSASEVGCVWQLYLGLRHLECHISDCHSDIIISIKPYIWKCSLHMTLNERRCQRLATLTVDHACVISKREISHG